MTAFANTAVMAPAFAAIRRAGFDVYIPVSTDPRPRPLTYAFFTDGVRIGYIQRGDYNYGFRLTTVHLANVKSGTGFSLTDPFKALEAEELTPRVLGEAFIDAPRWATQTERESVRKWKDMETFLASYWGKLELLADDAA